MAWKRGNPGCGCCSSLPPTCDCPNGGVSRKFAGTPTVIVTIEDLPSTVSFETVYQSGLIAQNFWTTVTIDDLDSYNGTYSWTLNKNAGGCIAHDSSNNRGGSLGTYPNSLVRRSRNSFADCILVGSPTNVNRTLTTQLTLGISSSPYQDTFQVVFRSTGFHSTGQPGDAVIFEFAGSQRLICSKDFDPLEDEMPEFMGAGLGGFSFNPKDQNIYLVYASDLAGRCVSPEARVLHQIGKITAEIIDDVP